MTDDTAPEHSPAVPALQPAADFSAAGARAETGGAPARRGSFLREVAIVLVSALLLSWLIKTFLVQAFYIPSESMEDTLKVNDRVMVSRMVPDVFDVHRGDVVVFQDPGGWLGPQYTETDRGALGNGVHDVLTWVGLVPQDSEDHLVKRVIGTPGDHVTCCDAQGRVQVNGQSIDETYVKPGSVPSEIPFDVTVPDDMLFVMGDNRQHSADSRYNTGKPGGGFVPMDDVTGTAFLRVWPLDRFAFLRNPGDVFADVPAP